MSVKQSKLKYEGAKDRLQKLEEVYKVLKLTANQTSEECPVVMLREAWEEGGYLYMCSDYCQLGNLNDFTTKNAYAQQAPTTKHNSSES